MSLTISSSVQPSLGVEPRRLIVRCRNSEASSTISRGALVRLDFALASGSTESGQGTAAITAASNSVFANVVLGPTTGAATTSGFYGIAQESIAAGATGAVMLAGITTANVASATYAVGQRVGLSASAITAGTMTNATTTQTIAVVLVGGTTVTSITVLLPGDLSFGITA
jgi:hypothetical protein